MRVRENEKEQKNIAVAKQLADVTVAALTNTKGAVDVDTTEHSGEETDDECAAKCATTHQQEAMLLHVAMHNAVYGTKESLTTTPEGVSTCDLCGSVLTWSAEGPRTATKHFSSKKHNDSRKLMKLPAVQDREHTVGDMHAVLGLKVVRESKIISSLSLTPSC